MAQNRRDNPWEEFFVDDYAGSSDTDKVSAAIEDAQAAGRGVAKLSPRSYTLPTPPTIPSNVALVGAGIDATTLTAGANNQHTLLVAAGASNVAIRDLTASGNRTLFPTGGGVAIGSSGNVTNLELTRVKATNGQAFSVFLDTGSGGYARGRITNCIFEDSGQGYDTFGSGQLTDYVFTGCIWRNTTGQGFATTNSTGGVTLQGCFFEGPMGNAISGEPISRLTVTGCTFHNLGDGTIGIYVHPIAGLTSDPTEIEITGNLFYNTGTVGGLLTDNAIFLRNVANATITGNVIRRMGRSGIVISSATVANSANVVRNVAISGNVVTDSNQDNAGSTPNVLVDNNAGTLTDVTVTGNVLSKSEGSSAATHGVLEQGSPANCLYVGNDVTGVGTAGIGFGSGTTSRAHANRGFNPQGAAAITVTASPFTYTNNDSVSEAVYIRGGTVSDISKNTTTLFTATGTTVWLEPGEAVVVTYSAAPTMVKDRK